MARLRRCSDTGRCPHRGHSAPTLVRTRCSRATRRA